MSTSTLDLSKGIELDSIATEEVKEFKQQIQEELSAVIKKIYLFVGEDLALI